MFHPDNEKYIKDANIYFECYYNYIQKHSLTDLKLTFQRSNGNLCEGTVPVDSGILFINSKDTLSLYIEFIENNQTFFKWVAFNDTVSTSTDIEMKGLISLNPELKEKELIIYIKNHPEWLDDFRKEWKDKMINYLDNIPITYSLRYQD